MKADPQLLGRLHVEDDRDKQFPMEAAIPSADPGITYKYWWPGGWWGDQGRTPQCVAYSWMHLIEDGPITHFYDTNDDQHEKPLFRPVEIYKEAQRVDQWPGENYDGTSVRAGAKVLRRRGVIAEYRWAWNIYTVKDALLRKGPLVVGTWWYHDMFFPDKDGLITVGGARVGGHAYVLNGINLEKGLIRLKNSWGRNWGKKGYAYISIDDFDRLLRENGEACMPLEKKLEL